MGQRAGVLLLLVVLVGSPTNGRGEPGNIGLGTIATQDQIQAWDIDVAPDGQGLPVGSGTVMQGAVVYAERCAGCHGVTGVEGPSPKLVGEQGTLASAHPLKTVGSYWPYATTLFDYIYRAMPFVAPQSLTPDQVYAVTAWILFRNGLLKQDAMLDQETLPKVRMLNRNGFVPDPRPDVNRSVEPGRPSSSLGEIDFPTSGSRKAQRPFLRGVLLLHNFEYDEARTAFQQAQALDPGFAMAYWGEAMTMTHPLWGEQDVQGALEILQRLGPTPDRRMAAAPTRRERGYLGAVEALYGEGDKKQRDHAYMAAMQALAKEFPEDDNARTLYALSILGSTQGQREEKRYLEAASIAQAVFERNPRHPGAVHYLIHALDDPAHAHGALKAARVYADLASMAPHALHMPSHIFMALGLWDDAVRTNERSWAASEERRIRKALGVQERAYHVAHWLMYALLQQGRVEEAESFLRMVEEDAKQANSRTIERYRAAMRATSVIETRKWDVTGFERDWSALQVSAALGELFAIGMSAARTGQVPVVEQVLEEFRRQMERVGGSPAQALPVEVMLKELTGMFLMAQGKNDKGLMLLRKAALLEETIPHKPGPPFPVKPAHELLGEALWQLGKEAEARHQFALALKRAPNRALSVDGLVRATAGTPTAFH